MLRAPLIATPAIVVVVAVIVPLVSSEFVSVSIVAGLIAVIGAWCVPASYTQGETGSLLTVGRDVWSPRLVGIKTLQIVAAGAMIVGLVALGLLDAALAAMFGIAVALAIGALSGSAEPSGSAHAGQSSQHAHRTH